MPPIPIAISKAQIALAFVVLKCKPKDMSVEGRQRVLSDQFDCYLTLLDHLHNLRECLVKGRRKVPVESQQYIDGTRFWKLAYERMEVENTALKDKIFVLEHSANKSSLPESTAPTAAKRKSESLGNTRANIQTKRRRVEDDTPGETVITDLEIDLENKPSSYRLLLRSFFELHKCTAKHEHDSKAICRAIKDAVRNAGEAFDALSKPRALPSNTTPRTTGLLEDCRVLTKIWMSVLCHIHKLEQLDADLAVTCLPAITVLVQKFLRLIQKLCLDDADDVLGSKKKKRAEAVKAGTMPRSQLNQDTRVLCKGITTMLCQMVNALDLNIMIHSSILETFMCSFLEHIGSCLSLIVFAEAGTPIEKQQGILPPCGLLDVAHIDCATAVLTTQLVAPYLVLILQQVMPIIDRMSVRQQTRMLKLDTMPGGSDVSVTTMMNKMKQRLQNTLLKGVYGDDDTTFDEALARCANKVATDVETGLAGIDEKADMSEWFIGQVWEHLGWDILAAKRC